MADPDEEAINNLRGKVNSYGPKVDINEENLKQYQKDYDNYQEKLKKLEAASGKIESGNEYLRRGQSELNKYSSGNKAGDANGVFSDVMASLASISSSGIESIKIYILKDVERLIQDYKSEHQDYSSNIATYNGAVSDLRGYGVYDYKNKEITITKQSLL